MPSGHCCGGDLGGRRRECSTQCASSRIPEPVPTAVTVTRTRQQGKAGSIPREQETEGVVHLARALNHRGHGILEMTVVAVEQGVEIIQSMVVHHS